ncbi:hypothetical protein Tco_1248410 [Tanacetum coccineum]
MKLLHPSKDIPLGGINWDDLDEEEAIKITEKKNLENDIVDETLEVDEIVNIKESRNHPLENVNEARGAKDTLGILFWGVMHKRFGVITSWDFCYDLKSLLSNVEQFNPL